MEIIFRFNTSLQRQQRQLEFSAEELIGSLQAPLYVLYPNHLSYSISSYLCICFIQQNVPKHISRNEILGIYDMKKNDSECQVPEKLKFSVARCELLNQRQQRRGELCSLITFLMANEQLCRKMVTFCDIRIEKTAFLKCRTEARRFVQLQFNQMRFI